MFLGLIKDYMFVPTEYKETIFDIDYEKYKEMGIKVLFLDLDNTFISYRENEANENHVKLSKRLHDLGFTLFFISNNSKTERVSNFSSKIGALYVTKAMKPLKKGFKKALKMLDKEYMCDEILCIGDQIMTDIYASNRMGYCSVLVKSIDKTKIPFTTKVNLIFERHVLKRLKKHDEKIYKLSNLDKYAGEVYGI